MSEYHEPPEALSESVRDQHRALTSLKEEIEAVDWYNQRVAACGDNALAAILAHNRDEEIEHAVMTLEWLRRTMPVWDTMLRKFMFTEASIVSAEGDEGEDSGPAPAGGLGIGSRRHEVAR